MTTLSTLICLRCGCTWVPRIEAPKRCPGCKSPYWNVPRKEKLVPPAN